MSSQPWFTHYETGVPTSVEIPDISLPQLLAESAKKSASQTAVHLVLKYLPLGLAIQSRLTYAELNEITDRFAVALQKLGVHKGDRVSLMLPNLPQQIIAYFGILKTGAIVVNTNPTYTARELQHQLTDCGAETIILLSGLYERFAQIRDHTPVKHVILTDIAESLGWPFKGMVEKQTRASHLMQDVAPGPGLYRLYDLIKQANGQPTPVSINNDDIALFQYSGGTTGVPKAAMLTHHNLISNVMQMVAWFTPAEYGKEKVLCALPFFHVYGMTVGMLLGIALGAELVVVPDPRNANHILETINHEKITLYPGVPGMYIAIVNHPKVQQYNLRSIKACLSGAAALPVEVAQKFESITGGRLVEGFGMTETSPTITANPIQGESRAGSVGLPLPNTEIRLVELDPDAQGNYADVAEGKEGELLVRGPQVMHSYWNMPDETAKMISQDQWLHTGDIAKMDKDGYFYIVDRKKDLIIASGYKVVPREVEEVLFTFPKVREAAVAGVPDTKRGETVKAYIILKEGTTATEDEIRTHCKENLAPYKVPSLIEFRTELPKSQIGKVIRRMLVEEEKAKLAKT
ncbi:MAG: long-chain fatty acid--CoA ligase [Chloroflexi bacterium]|nr:long-chain fatty acid--CoA ligase [Chloroflexota bacterium]